MSEQAYEDWTIVSRISQHGRHRDHTRVTLVPSFRVVLLAHNCKYIVNTFVNSNKKLKWLIFCGLLGLGIVRHAVSSRLLLSSSQ